MNLRGSPKSGCLMYLLGIWGLISALAALVYIPTGGLYLMGVIKEMPGILKLTLPDGLATPDWNYLALGLVCALMVASIEIILHNSLLGLIGIYLATAGMIALQVMVGIGLVESLRLFLWPVLVTILLWAPWEKAATARAGRETPVVSAQKLERMIANDDYTGLVQAKASGTDPEENEKIGRILRSLAHPDKIPALKTFLNDPDPALRREAAQLLGEIQDARAEKALADFPKDPEPEVRAAVVESLVKFPSPTAFRQVVRSLQDEDGLVRATAARALSDCGDPQAVEPLLRLLNDTDETVLLAAVNALARLGDRRAAQPLQSMLGRYSKNEAVKNAIVSALLDMGA